MSSKPIKRLAPRACPQCGTEDAFAIREAGITCRRCGYVLRDEGHRPQRLADIDPNTAVQNKRKSPPPAASALDELDALFADLIDDDGAGASTPRRTGGSLAADGPRRPYTPRFNRSAARDLDAWGSAAYESAIHHAQRGEWVKAEAAFKRLLESERDFVEAHLALAMFAHDLTVAEDHLTTVLAYEPGNMVATRELMVLRGELDPDAPVLDAYAAPEKREAGGAVDAATQNTRCSRCGSPHLIQDPISGSIQCSSCGHVDESAGEGAASVGGLTAALLKRRAQPVLWQVGERLLHCKSCGAERTISPRAMTHECPFCGSQHIITRDALASFQQPDGIIPFALSEDEAQAALEARLGGWMEKLSGLFTENRADRITFEGVYLPYWFFDASMNVRRTMTRNQDGIGYTRDSNRYSMSMQQPYETEIIPDAITDVQIPAVRQPKPALTRRLGKFPDERIKPYDPRLLGGFAAEIYTLDFDKASLEARSVIAEEMREKHTFTAQTRSSDVTITIFTEFSGMQFQLVLVPVWVAAIRERDGDLRTALINGQTGQVVLSRAHKPGS